MDFFCAIIIVRRENEFMRKILTSKYIRVAIFILILIFMITGCSQESEDAPKGIFYKVLGGYNEMYILGSVHLGSEDMYPIDSAIETAYNTSSTLVVEANINEINQSEINQVLQEYAFFQDGTTLTDHLDDKLYNKVTEIISSDILEEEILVQLKPWYIAQIITQTKQQRTKYEFKYGVDQYFLNRAENKEIIGLETIKEQIEPFSHMSMETSIKYLKNTIDEAENMEENLSNIIEYWYNGDYDTVAKLKKELKESIDTNSYEQYITALLDERDYEIAQELDSMIRHDINEQYFVVVGYLHLSGQNSLITYLEDLGYTLEIAN